MNKLKATRKLELLLKHVRTALVMNAGQDPEVAEQQWYWEWERALRDYMNEFLNALEERGLHELGEPDPEDVLLALKGVTKGFEKSFWLLTERSLAKRERMRRIVKMTRQRYDDSREEAHRLGRLTEARTCATAVAACDEILAEFDWLQLKEDET
jgi:hypothetical protein